jgi:hypothetical protein
MKMHMFAILNKVKYDEDNVRGIDLAAVWRTTVQVTELSL